MALFFACSAPIYKTFIKNEKELIVPVILPFNDPETENGFYINYANQGITCGIGVIMISASEILTCLLKNSVALTAAVIENLLKHWQKMRIFLRIIINYSIANSEIFLWKLSILIDGFIILFSHHIRPWINIFSPEYL